MLVLAMEFSRGAPRALSESDRVGRCDERSSTDADDVVEGYGYCHSLKTE